MVTEYLEPKNVINMYPHPSPPISPEYDCCLNIAEPTSKEIYESSSIFQKRKYTPYKRVSHFREHINRINFSQFLTIPKECFIIIEQWIQNNKNTQEQLFWKNDIYEQLKRLLSRKFKSKCIEFIPFLINHYRKQKDIFHLTVNYSDYGKMCEMFKQLEQQYCINDSQYIFNRKRRFISYYVIIQCLFTAFHSHPSYDLPTLKNNVKRDFFYDYIFKLIKNHPLLKCEIKRLFISRLNTCKKCHIHTTFRKQCSGLDNNVKKFLYANLFQY